jgi:hypothetical protein
MPAASASLAAHRDPLGLFVIEPVAIAACLRGRFIAAADRQNWLAVATSHAEACGVSQIEKRAPNRDFRLGDSKCKASLCDGPAPFVTKCKWVSGR